MTLRRMAEQLADLPEDQAFGQIEFTLRDLVRALAASSHQTGLQTSGLNGSCPMPGKLPPTALPSSMTTRKESDRCARAGLR